MLREFRAPEGESAAHMDANGDGDILVVVDLREDESLLEAFFAREVVNRIQKMRKAAGLQESDRVDMWVTCDDDPQLEDRLRTQVRVCMPGCARGCISACVHMCRVDVYIRMTLGPNDAIFGIRCDCA